MTSHTHTDTTEHPAFAKARALPEDVRRFFPTSRAEAVRWEPELIWRALDATVLAVAVPRIEGTWRGYIKQVPGMWHKREAVSVQRHGCPLAENIARAIFPRFAAVDYAR